MSRQTFLEAEAAYHEQEHEMGKFKELAITMEEAGIRDVLTQRGKRYGEYIDVSATSQTLKGVIEAGDAYDEMEFYMKESLAMIANKLARIVNGDPYYDDSWRDIAGYAQLVVDELDKLK